MNKEVSCYFPYGHPGPNFACVCDCLLFLHLGLVSLEGHFELFFLFAALSLLGFHELLGGFSRVDLLDLLTVLALGVFLIVRALFLEGLRFIFPFVILLQLNFFRHWDQPVQTADGHLELLVQLDLHFGPRLDSRLELDHRGVVVRVGIR